MGLEDSLETRKDFIACFEDIDEKILFLRLKEYFSYKENFHYGIQYDNKIVGFLFSTKVNKVFELEKSNGLYILDFVVHPYFRGKKLGSNLLKFYVNMHENLSIIAHTRSLVFERMLRRFDFKKV
ncbi:GNAT family N-acetyltransferase [bacterium]|nr:GNAT family N-acetyltransferase [bacterium]MBU1958972.1 GNAT family N-acetyltransferase [bacterium]